MNNKGFSNNNFHEGDVVITGDLVVDQDVEIKGDLDVKGTITSINELEVKDPLIKLANGNTADTFDIGYYGQYNAGFGTRYNGLIKPSGTDTFNLFTNEPTEPTPGGSVFTYWGNLKLSQLFVQSQTGAVSTPSISGFSDTDTGLQWNTVNPDILFISTGNTRNFALSTTDLKIGDFDGSSFYSLPLTRGTNGQILKTDASGVVTWQNDTSNSALALDGSTQMDASAQIIMDDGLASAPGLTIAGDLTTGIYQPSVGELAVTISGNEKVKFDTTEITTDSNLIMNATGPDVRREIDIFAEHDTSSSNIKFYRRRNAGAPNMTANSDLLNIFGLGWSSVLNDYWLASVLSFEATATWTGTNYPNQFELRANSGSLGICGVYFGYDGTENRCALTPTNNTSTPEFNISSTLANYRVAIKQTVSNVQDQLHLIETTSTGGSFITLQLDTNPANRRRVCFYMSNFEDMRICSQNDAGANILDLFKIRNAVTQTDNGVETQPGTSSNTAYGFINEPTSGMYKIGTANIGFSTNSINRLSISNTEVKATVPFISSTFDSSSGSVNLGTTNATSITVAKLGVNTEVKGTITLEGVPTIGAGVTNWTLPITRATQNGQVLTSNASGFVTFQTPVFGQHYQYANSAALSTTTSTTFQQKLRLTTGTLTSGNYKISWYAELKNDSGTGGNIQVRLDDTTPPTGGTLIAVGFTDSSIDGGFIAQSGFYNQSLTAAVHTIDLNYNAGAGTSSIQRGRLEIMRVS